MGHGKGCRNVREQRALVVITRSQVDGTVAKDAIEEREDVQPTTEKSAGNIHSPNSKTGKAAATNRNQGEKTEASEDYVVVHSREDSGEEDVDGFIVVDPEKLVQEERTDPVRWTVRGLFTPRRRWM